jgi:hypothetical protein
MSNYTPTYPSTPSWLFDDLQDVNVIEHLVHKDILRREENRAQAKATAWRRLQGRCYQINHGYLPFRYVPAATWQTTATDQENAGQTLDEAFSQNRDELIARISALAVALERIYTDKASS